MRFAGRQEACWPLARAAYSQANTMLMGEPLASRVSMILFQDCAEPQGIMPCAYHSNSLPCLTTQPFLRMHNTAACSDKIVYDRACRVVLLTTIAASMHILTHQTTKCSIASKAAAPTNIFHPCTHAICQASLYVVKSFIPNQESTIGIPSVSSIFRNQLVTCCCNTTAFTCQCTT